MDTTKYKKLILMALDWTRPKDPPISLGHASLLANLHKNNMPVITKTYSVNSIYFSIDELIEFAFENANHSKTLLAFGVFIWNEKIIQTIIKRLKQENFRGIIVLGGPQISYTQISPEKFYPQTDIFIRGYAEDALVNLLMGQKKPGIHYRGQKNSDQLAFVFIEELPSIFLTGLIKPQPFIRWETKRGCPFRCAFCQHRGATLPKPFPLTKIIKEAEWITNNAIINDIAIIDPTFNEGSSYLTILHTLTHGGFKGKLSLQCRLELVTDEFLNAVETLNKTAQVTLEFGLQTIHKDEQSVINRPTNMQKVKETLKKLQQREINTEISIIYGLPKQTLHSFKETIRFCQQYHPTAIRAFPLMLLRGTVLYEKRHQLGLVESENYEKEDYENLIPHIPLVVENPSFKYFEWLEMKRIANSLACR
jgi:radical SAM superfamily enzyme YgiQ (UPF0313 family)